MTTINHHPTYKTNQSRQQLRKYQPYFDQAPRRQSITLGEIKSNLESEIDRNYETLGLPFLQTSFDDRWLPRASLSAEDHTRLTAALKRVGKSNGASAEQRATFTLGSGTAAELPKTVSLGVPLQWDQHTRVDAQA